MKLAQTLLSGSLAAVALAASAPAMAGKVLDGVKQRDQLVRARCLVASCSGWPLPERFA